MKLFAKFLIAMSILAMLLTSNGCGGNSNKSRVTPSPTPSVEIPAPRAWWKLEETAVPLADSGTPVGLSVPLKKNSTGQLDELGVPGRVGSGVHSTNGYAFYKNVDPATSDQVKALNFTTAMTAEAWVKLDDLVGDYASTTAGGRGYALIITKGDPGTYGYHLYISEDNSLRFRIDTAEAVSTTTLNTKDQWYHVLGTFDGSTIKVYINGQLAGSAPYTGTISHTQDKDIRIGSNTSTTTNPVAGIKGYLDEVRLYDVALTAAQAEARYTLTNSIPAVTPTPMPTPTPSGFVYPEVPANLQYLHDVEIGTGGSSTIKMEICYPKTDPGTPWPVLVYIHGGGWNHGSKDEHANKIVGYAERGYVGVAIQYRLTGTAETVYPAQIEDCKLAIRYLRAHASQYYLNPNKIGVWGTSAGAHLAALLGTLPEGQFEGTGGWATYSSRVNAVVDHYGPANFLNPLVDNSSSVIALLGCKPSQDPDKARSAMPSTFASADDPPFLIMHGTADTTVDPADGPFLCDILKAAGVDATFHSVEGAGHSFSAFPEVSVTTWAFLDQHLKN